VSEEKEVKRDLFGTEMKVGSWVAYGDGNRVRMGRIIKITVKMVRVQDFKRPQKDRRTDRDTGSLRYAEECVVLDEAQVMWYMLKNS
jgi:hypothetical protein